MNEQKTVQMIQAAPDAVVRQGYVKKNGRKRLDHVIWSSALLGLEARIDIPCIAPEERSLEMDEQLVGECASSVLDETNLDDSNTSRAASRGRRERKE